MGLSDLREDGSVPVFGRGVGCLVLVSFAGAALVQPAEPPGLEVAAGEACAVCGEIRSIREVPAPKKPLAQPGIRTQPGPAQSDLQQSVPVGPTLSLPFGGNGDYGWRLGAGGRPGTQAGFDEITYEVIVRMDSGEHRSLLRSDGPRFTVGGRVTLREGALELR